MPSSASKYLRSAVFRCPALNNLVIYLFIFSPWKRSRMNLAFKVPLGVEWLSCFIMYPYSPERVSSVKYQLLKLKTFWMQNSQFYDRKFDLIQIFHFYYTNGRPFHPEILSFLKSWWFFQVFLHIIYKILDTGRKNQRENWKIE